MKTMFLTLGLIVTVSTTSAESQSKEVSDLVSQIETLTMKKNADYKKYAESIIRYSKQYQIDPQVVIALIMTESSFNPSAVSVTGDIGLGQINPKKWGPDFQRLFNEKLDAKKLMINYDYSIQKTIQILSYHKNRSKKDPHWVGKYHSKTPTLKMAYFKRVESRMNKIIPQSIASSFEATNMNQWDQP